MSRLIPFALLAAALLTTAALAQVIQQYGHQLDANLQLGSGGYNRRVSAQSELARQGYTVGSSRSLYVVGGDGSMYYSPHNAFTPTSRYAATGYRGQYTGAGRSSASLSRFRYY